MSQPVQWGIIGSGAIAKAFTTALTQTDAGELVAVGSRAKASAKKFLDENNAGRGTAHGSYEDLLADGNVQAVYISTPHPFHAAWAIRAIEAGKAVLCEKPLAVHHAHAMAMINEAAERRVFFMEAFMYRCHPQTIKLVELIRSDAIGEVHLVQASFGFQAGFNPDSRVFNNDLAGGGILDVGCYPVSFARLVAGAVDGKRFADPVDGTGSAVFAPTGVDARAVGTLRFANGVLAEVATSVTTNLENKVRIFGDKGHIEVPNPWTHDRTSGGAFELHVRRKGAEPETVMVTTDRTAYAYEIEVVARALAAGELQAEAPAMDWADSLGNIQTLDRWRRAVGLVYEQEKPERLTTPAHGRPLKRSSNAPMKHASIDGVKQPVSRLIMGCDNQMTHTHAAAMFDAYFERGGNTFDTAYLYGGGKQERLLGWWLKARGVRDQAVVIGKGAHTPYCTPQGITDQLNETLDRLGVDHLDIYMMHRDNLEVPVGEFIDVLNEHHKAGRIGVFGGSNWSIERFEQANAYAREQGKQPMTVLSNNFSLARMVDPVWVGCIAASDPESRAWHENTQTPNLAWSSQARGFFTGRADVPAEEQSDKDLVRCWYSDDNMQRRERAIELAKKYGVLPINIAAAYVLCQPFPSFALFGPRALEEMRTSLPALDVELSPDELAWLNLETADVPV
ncbi:aldo/keto reductase [Phycisphaerales bacterium AB-hyl4]|uniref:Aldo/keto reductase n=1 Tax=Natronomicrosphaera hydrolytica TaxID=3242702 RepID=A0ABV4U563_9BACT